MCAVLVFGGGIGRSSVYRPNVGLTYQSYNTHWARSGQRRCDGNTLLRQHLVCVLLEQYIVRQDQERVLFEQYILQQDLYRVRMFRAVHTAPGPNVECVLFVRYLLQRDRV